MEKIFIFGFLVITLENVLAVFLDKETTNKFMKFANVFLRILEFFLGIMVLISNYNNWLYWVMIVIVGLDLLAWRISKNPKLSKVLEMGKEGNLLEMMASKYFGFLFVFSILILLSFILSIGISFVLLQNMFF